MAIVDTYIRDEPVKSDSQEAHDTREFLEAMIEHECTINDTVTWRQRRDDNKEVWPRVYWGVSWVGSGHEISLLFEIEVELGSTVTEGHTMHWRRKREDHKEIWPLVYWGTVEKYEILQTMFKPI